MWEKGLCLTNNPLVIQGEKKNLVFVHGDSLAVFRSVREKLLAGRHLLTHPLAGGWGPGVNLYRSVMVSINEEELLSGDLALVDRAISQALRWEEDKGEVNIDAAVLSDMQYMDFMLIKDFLE